MHDARTESVHEFTQNDAVAERVLVADIRREALPDHRLYPVLSLTLLLWLPFSSNLYGKKESG